MKLNVLLTVLNLLSVWCDIIVHNKSMDEYFDTCLENIIEVSKEVEETLVIINRHSHISSVNKVIQKRNSKNYWPYMQYFANDTCCIKNHRRKNMFILTIVDVDEFKFHLLQLKKSLLWNSRGKYIVITENHNSKFLSDIFSIFWEFNIYKAIIVIKFSDVTSKIYTWYPYAEFSCGNNFDKIKIIAKCKRNKLIQNKPLFEDKITTIYNCPVRTRAILWSPFIMRVDNEYTGIEVSMLKTISEVLKFNPIFSVSKVPLNWGSINETGGATGLLGALIKNKADIGIASLGYDITRSRYLDYGVPYNFEYLTYCVPPVCESSWLRLSLPFDLFSTILLACSYLCTSYLVYSLSKFNKTENCFYKNICNSLFINFAMIIGTTSRNSPRGKVRVVTGCWCVFCWIISILYVTSMIGRLTRPVCNQQIQTFQDIVNYGLKLQYLEPQKRYFLDKSKQSKFILNNWNSCKKVQECLDRVAYNKDAVISLPKLYIDSIKSYYVDANKKSLLYCLKNYFVSYPITMLMKKDFPLRNRINTVILRICGAGLFQLWESVYLRCVGKTKSQDHTSVNTRFVKFVDVKFAFINLSVGYTIAFFCFLFELTFDKFKNCISRS